MIIILKSGTPGEEITRISQEVSETWGVTVEKSVGTHKAVLGLIGDTTSIDKLQVQEFSPWMSKYYECNNLSSA
jgi:3-deoxy-7-phosphoheptulonate synthase